MASSSAAKIRRPLGHDAVGGQAVGVGGDLFDQLGPGQRSSGRVGHVGVGVVGNDDDVKNGSKTSAKSAQFTYQDFRHFDVFADAREGLPPISQRVGVPGLSALARAEDVPSRSL